MNTLTGTTWFPSTLENAFIPSLRISFIIGAIFSFIAALLSALRGKSYIHEDEVLKPGSKAYLKQQEYEKKNESRQGK